MTLSDRQLNILKIIDKVPGISISEIKKLLSSAVSIPTLNRDLAHLTKCLYLTKSGQGRATNYSTSAYYKILTPVNVDSYFEIDTDNRNIIKSFNHEVWALLEKVELFSEKEKKNLQELQLKYQNAIKDFPPTLYQKELERLIIELSWKSAQIEGNTYSLLETERLFLEREEASNKTHEEAVMLLNHKHALDYLLNNKNLGRNIDVRFIEEVHSLLIKDMNVSRNIRSRTVGITGTAYKPLDNKHQIIENIDRMCHLINKKENFFEKSLLALTLISYIQPFEDGNKRTARMISNSILIAHGACPLSFRSISPLDYKKAMLIFYEQNNISEFKKRFIDQNIFSSLNYFQ